MTYSHIYRDKTYSHVYGRHDLLTLLQETTTHTSIEDNTYSHIYIRQNLLTHLKETKAYSHIYSVLLPENLRAHLQLSV